MAEIAAYVLRIMSDYWVNNVFDMTIYYTNLRRKWKPDQSIIFINKTKSGDSVVGYGVIENVCQQNELPEEERREPEKWKEDLVFKYVIKFEKPLPIKKTFLKEPKFRGKFLHGLALNGEQLDSILRQAESPSK
jgi:tRNA uridine 5-carbamoylmethylation protein Kti12